MPSHKSFLTFVIIISLGVSIITYQATSNSLDIAPNALPSTINIGFLTPQTGNLSPFSIGFENAANLAVKELNQNYPAYLWNLSIYDTKTNASEAANAMNNAIGNGSAFVVGAAGSASTISAAALATTNQVPLIRYASTSPNLTTFDDHYLVGDEGYLWRIPPSDAQQGHAMADYAKNKGYSTAVFIVNVGYGSWFASSFNERFTTGVDAGIILKEFTYDPSNLTTMVSEVKTLNPDVVIAALFELDGSDVFVEMYNQNVNKPIIGTDGIAGDSIFSQSPLTIDAMQNVTAIRPQAFQTPSVESFRTAYMNEYGAFPGPNGIYLGESYDAVWVGALALLAADSTAGADIISKLATTNYDGGSGHIEFDVNGDPIRAIYEILKVRIDKYVKSATWANGFISYARIVISSEADFNTLGFPGSGFGNDPYRIEGLDIIDYSPNTLIEISDISAYVTIKDNVLDGKLVSQGGIKLTNVINCKIENNVITGIIGDAINLWSSSNNHIDHNELHGNTEAGITVGGSTSLNNAIDNNTIYDNLGWSGIDIGDSIGTQVLNNTVHNHPNGNGITLGYFGMNLNAPSEFLIHNNTVYANKYRGIRVESSDGNTITENTVYGNFEDGILLHESMQNKVFDNVLSDNHWSAILIDQSHDNHIRENTLSNPTLNRERSLSGIAISTSQNNLIESNTLHNFEFAIDLGASDFNNITSNILFDNINGIIVGDDSNDNWIGHNEAENNEQGISISPAANRNTLTGNLLIRNYWAGIYIASYEIEVNANTFYKNNAAIIIDSTGRNNIIEKNDFIANNLEGFSQVNDAGSANTFTGNFWDDWTGPDKENDLIVDNPYEIESLNKDLFPVTTPYNPDRIHFLSRIKLFNPDLTADLSGKILFEWTPAIDSSDHPISYTFWISSDQGATWELAGEVNTASYEWDTTTGQSGTYQVKIIARGSDGLETEFISDEINISVTTSTADTTTSDTDTSSSTSESTAETPSSPVPYSNILSIIASFGLISIISRRKMKI
ncbi:MAG: right-handed parallel beta-helix repeat-containing protein [Candidatus Kariarchaeaceae archaeon]